MKKKVMVTIDSKDLKGLIDVLCSALDKQSVSFNPIKQNVLGKDIIEISY
ncbi:MAG TPA: hypothetical protein VJK51_03450 [Candidatus Nanoarchaeia archaeon]|nr:hypothetical protein [Candidatus Nanoarchaeia archaeon]